MSATDIARLPSLSQLSPKDLLRLHSGLKQVVVDRQFAGFAGDQVMTLLDPVFAHIEAVVLDLPITLDGMAAKAVIALQDGQIVEHAATRLLADSSTHMGAQV